MSKFQTRLLIPCYQRQNGILAQRNLDTGFLLRNGLLCYAASLIIRNRYAMSQRIMEFPMRRSHEPFLLRRKRRSYEAFICFIRVASLRALARASYLAQSCEKSCSRDSCGTITFNAPGTEVKRAGVEPIGSPSICMVTGLGVRISIASLLS